LVPNSKKNFHREFPAELPTKQSLDEINARILMEKFKILEQKKSAPNKGRLLYILNKARH
jgi:hypothetical protein